VCQDVFYKVNWLVILLYNFDAPLYVLGGSLYSLCPGKGHEAQRRQMGTANISKVILMETLVAPEDY
jgi:hypothetical protein